MVVETLVEEFNIFREEGGESVPVHSQDACNGLQRNGREGETAVKERHTIMFGAGMKSLHGCVYFIKIQ